MTDNPGAAPDETAADEPMLLLKQECDQHQALFAAQPPIIQRFLEAQARQLAEAITQGLSQTRFTLPDRVVLEATGAGAGTLATIPPDTREQFAGGLVDRLTGTGLASAVRQRLAELSGSADRAVAASADLTRHATARYMLYGMLPSGRPVQYVAAKGEEIPAIPVETGGESAITAATDAIVEEGDASAGRDELLSPYVPSARRFFLPQWVMFDDEDRLLVGSVAEAQARLASMQRFVAVLHAAVALAPYVVADEEYQRKRYGMLGQLINQGRALARYETREIVAIIKKRAAAEDLNRGLSLSLPYFDDQALEMRTHDFTVIPAGRIMFSPAFVVRAAREEIAKVAQDTRLSPSTRKHLLSELEQLELGFGHPGGAR